MATPGCRGVAREVVPGLAPGPHVRKKEVVQIKEDHYLHYRFRAEGEVSVQVRVASGPAIDVYFVDAARFDDYVKKKQFRFYPALSQENTRSFRASGSVAPGEYALVLDNTDYGAAKPPWNMADDVATIEVEIKSDR